MADKATWVAAGDPRNPFKCDILDLMVTQTVVATTSDPANAERAISWGGSLGAELDLAPTSDRPEVPCLLRLSIDRNLPEGILFAPSSMDQKFVIAWRGGRVIAARSWTGSVEAAADARVNGGELIIERIRATEASPLAAFGALPETFEWLLRSHALGEKLPFPVNDDGARVFENTPLAAFAAFGNVIFCAARTWTPPPASRPLRSNGRIIHALRASDLEALARAVEEGEDVDAPSTFGGYTALHLAVLRGETAWFERLVSLGADPNRRADRGMNTIGIAVVHKGSPELFAALEARGVDLLAANVDGFNALHAAGEAGNAWAVPWLLARGHDCEARTKRGHTALQIACALGHLAAAKALVEAGADARATSPDGTALEIARREGKDEIVSWLASAGT